MKPVLTFLAFLLILSSACQNLEVLQQTSTETGPGFSSEETTLPFTTEQATQESLTPAVVAPEIKPLNTPTTAPTATLTPPQAPPEARPQYAITATLDYGWRYLSVQQDITIPNPSAETLSELILVVQPNWRPDTFKLTSLTWQDGSPITTYTLEGIRLKVLLLEPFKPGESLQLSLAYEIDIPPLVTSEDFGPNPFGFTARQINLTDWYPFVPPYLSDPGWLVHNPWYYGEHLVYPSADFDVTLKLINAPDGTVIASSAPDLGDDNLHHYQLKDVRNFVFSISPEYRRFQEQVGTTTVLGYAFPYDAVPGEVAFRTTVEALELYNHLFGPYPYQSLTMVQADFDHGMEYSGLYFLSKAFYSTYDGTTSTYLVAIAAHETAHQWWYGLVGNDQAMEPWLDEALCTYSEKLFYQNLYPDSLDWWQSYRVDYYQPAGWVNSALYNTPGYREYRDAVYLNGANFLEDLRALVGDQVFLAFLQDYLARNTGKIATSDLFFTILREHSEADWAPLVAKYFNQP